MLTGDMIIGQERVRGKHGFYAIDPRANSELEPMFYGAQIHDVERACELAAAAFGAMRTVTAAQRATFLEEVAQQIERIGEVLIERAHCETGLPLERLRGERSRTTGQLRLFAQTLRAGRWQAAVIERALPARVPPRPDLRMQRIPLGPVAVFGASNFPLAFSVAGGDTAAALAAGCPVVVKAHSAHPGTSELVGMAIQNAVRQAGLPSGLFSLLFGHDNSVGAALVAHRAIQAVAFTGSRAGGLALAEIVRCRPQPIPMYAEMSSINPVLLLPRALEVRGTKIASGLVDSLVFGGGQLCTCPGLIVAVRGSALDAFRQAVCAALQTQPSAVMLTPGIAQAYRSNEGGRAMNKAMSRLGAGQAAQGANEAVAVIYETCAADFLRDTSMHEEIFGPFSLLVVCQDQGEMIEVAKSVEGQLTFTLHADEEDFPVAAQLLSIAERKAGRILFNGFPTGVDVGHAMVHGGPYPASSDSRSTSVGTMALERFLRPVCYQNVPEALLPLALKEDNPLDLCRMEDGALMGQ